jgi:hypothetical protein
MFRSCSLASARIVGNDVGQKRLACSPWRKVKGHCSQVFRYAIATSRCSRDPCPDLRGALKPSPPVKHHKAVGLKDLPELLRRIDRYAEDFRDASTVAQLTSQLVLDYAAADYGIKGSRSGRAHANLGGAALVKKLIHASGFRPMRHSSVGPSLARPIARQRPPPKYRSGTDNEACRNPGERADRRCSGQSGADEIDHGGEQGGRCIQLLLQY